MRLRGIAKSLTEALSPEEFSKRKTRKCVLILVRDALERSSTHARHIRSFRFTNSFLIAEKPRSRSISRQINGKSAEPLLSRQFTVPFIRAGEEEREEKEIAILFVFFLSQERFARFLAMRLVALAPVGVENGVSAVKR